MDCQMRFETFRFCSKESSNCGNAISKNQSSNIFRGGHVPGAIRNMSSLWPNVLWAPNLSWPPQLNRIRHATGGNDTRKGEEKCFKIGTIHPHG